MPLTNAFHEAVASGNVRLVRIMMKDSLLVDLTFQEFKEMAQAAKSMPHLYDIHDNRQFETNENAWNDDYMNKLMVQVVNNFSKERLQHLMAVVRKLRPVTETRPSNTSRSYSSPQHSNEPYEYENHETHSYREQKRKDQRNGIYIGTRIAAGAAIGAAGGAIVAVATSASMPVCVAAGAAIGGVSGAVVSLMS